MSNKKDNVQNTIKAYKGLVPNEKLKPNYLKRPPVKFILFLFNEVVTKTGFGVGLVGEDLLGLSKSRTPLNKTQKMDFLTRLINFVGLCLRRPIPVYPSKIAAGKQVDKTNMLLQVFAKCARNKDGKYKHWENAVRMIQNGENPDMTGKAYEKEKMKKMESKRLKEEAEKLKNEQQPPPRTRPNQDDDRRKAEKLHEERLRKQKQEEVERLRDVQRRQEMDRKREALEKKKRQDDEERRRRLEEEAQKRHRQEMLDQSDTQDEEDGIDDTRQHGRGGHDDSIDPARNHQKGRPTSRKTMREIRHVGDGGIITRHITESSEDMVNFEKTMTEVDPKVGGGSYHQDGDGGEGGIIHPEVGGDQGRYDYSEQPIPHPSQLGQGREVEEEEEEEDGEEDEIDDDDEESRKGDQHGSYVMVHDQQLHRNDQFNRNSQISQEDMALTKKLMNRGQESQGSDKGKKTMEEEENEEDPNQSRRKKIFFGRKGESGRRGRDSHDSDLSYVRNGIQSVCESTNALGKSMDFIQEDLDSMKMELKKWRSMSFKYGNALQNEKRKTDLELKDARDKMFEANQAIENAVRKIHGSKAEILRNEQKIEDLLKNVVD